MAYWTCFFLFFSWLLMRQLLMDIQQTYPFRYPSEWRMKMTTPLFSQNKVIILKFQKVVDLVRQHFCIELFCAYFLWPFVFFIVWNVCSFPLFLFSLRFIFFLTIFSNLPKSVLYILRPLTGHVAHIFSVYCCFLILLKFLFEIQKFSSFI